MTKKQPNPVDKYVGQRARMRRLMLDMSQQELAQALGLTFQQVQKYEKGVNRMGSSRLQEVADILQVPVSFFFEGAPGQPRIGGNAPSSAYVSEFLGTAGGLTLARAFMNIKNAKLRRSIVNFVEEIVGE